jgi:hypothetical protein
VHDAWAPLALELLRSCARGMRLPPALVEHLRGPAGREHLPALQRRAIDSLVYIGCGLDVPQQRVYDRVWQQQRALLEALVGELTSRGVDALVIKGAEYLARSYRTHALGFMADIDILVPRGAIGVAKQVLYGMGFRQATVDKAKLALVDFDVAVVARTELDHHELAFFSRLDPIALDADEHAFVRGIERQPVFAQPDGGLTWLCVDVHHGVSIDVPSEPLFARAVPSALGVGRALSPADQVWVTLSRYYVEVALDGKRKLRDFAYVLPLLASPFAIDWDVVLEVSRDYGLKATLHYYLAFLQRLGAHVPKAVIDETCPDAGVQRDFGWQLTPLFGGTDPFPLEMPRDR